jgi:predicted transcriptional regulator
MLPSGSTKLAHILSEQGRKKTWLATKLQVDRSTVTRWIKGETTPRGFRKQRIAEALDVSVSDLF